MDRIFHISLPCKNLKKTVSYYKNELGLTIGRNTANWADINLFGNQMTFVVVNEFKFDFPTYFLEKESLPSFHFGIVLNNYEWDDVYDKINKWSIETVIKRVFLKTKMGSNTLFLSKTLMGII